MSFALFFAVLAPALISGFRSLLVGPAATDPNIDAIALQTFTSGSYADFLRANWRYDWYLTNSVGQIAYQVAIFGRLLLGLYAVRALVLADLRSHYTLFRTLLIAGAVVGIGGNILIAGHYLDSTTRGGFLLPFGRRLIAELGYLGLTLAYASGLALLVQRPRWVRPLRLLAPVGRMALTVLPPADAVRPLALLWLHVGAEFDGQDRPYMARLGMGEWVCDSIVVRFGMAAPFSVWAGRVAVAVAHLLENSTDQVGRSAC